MICISSPDRWGKTGVEFVTQTSLKKSRETTNTMILVTNGVGESDLVLVPVFCYSNQASMEVCNGLSALCQLDSWKPSVVVRRRYSDTPYIPRECPHSHYLDMGTLSRGVASTQFHLDMLHLCQLLPFSQQRSNCLLRCIPISQSSIGIVQRRITIFPVPSLCQSPCQLLHCFWKCAFRLRRIRQPPCLHTDRRWVRLSSCWYSDRRVEVSPFLKLLWEAN